MGALEHECMVMAIDAVESRLSGELMAILRTKGGNLGISQVWKITKSVSSVCSDMRGEYTVRSDSNPHSSSRSGERNKRSADEVEEDSRSKEARSVPATKRPRVDSGPDNPENSRSTSAESAESSQTSDGIMAEAQRESSLTLHSVSVSASSSMECNEGQPLCRMQSSSSNEETDLSTLSPSSLATAEVGKETPTDEEIGLKKLGKRSTQCRATARNGHDMVCTQKSPTNESQSSASDTQSLLPEGSSDPDLAHSTKAPRTTSEGQTTDLQERLQSQQRIHEGVFEEWAKLCLLAYNDIVVEVESVSRLPPKLYVRLILTMWGILPKSHSTIIRGWDSLLDACAKCQSGKKWTRQVGKRYELPNVEFQHEDTFKQLMRHVYLKWDGRIRITSKRVSTHERPNRSEGTHDGSHVVTVHSAPERDLHSEYLHMLSDRCCDAYGDLCEEVEEVSLLGHESAICLLLALWGVLPSHKRAFVSQWIDLLDTCLRSESGRKHVECYGEVVNASGHLLEDKAVCGTLMSMLLARWGDDRDSDSKSQNDLNAGSEGSLNKHPYENVSSGDNGNNGVGMADHPARRSDIVEHDQECVCLKCNPGGRISVIDDACPSAGDASNSKGTDSLGDKECTSLECTRRDDSSMNISESEKGSEAARTIRKSAGESIDHECSLENNREECVDAAVAANDSSGDGHGGLQEESENSECFVAVEDAGGPTPETLDEWGIFLCEMYDDIVGEVDKLRELTQYGVMRVLLAMLNAHPLASSQHKEVHGRCTRKCARTQSGKTWVQRFNDEAAIPALDFSRGDTLKRLYMRIRWMDGCHVGSTARSSDPEGIVGNECVESGETSTDISAASAGEAGMGGPNKEKNHNLSSGHQYAVWADLIVEASSDISTDVREVTNLRTASMIRLMLEIWNVPHTEGLPSCRPSSYCRDKCLSSKKGKSWADRFKRLYRLPILDFQNTSVFGILCQSVTVRLKSCKPGVVAQVPAEHLHPWVDLLFEAYKDIANEKKELSMLSGYSIAYTLLIMWDVIPRPRKKYGSRWKNSLDICLQSSRAAGWVQHYRDRSDLPVLPLWDRSLLKKVGRWIDNRRKVVRPTVSLTTSERDAGSDFDSDTDVNSGARSQLSQAEISREASEHHVQIEAKSGSSVDSGSNPMREQQVSPVQVSLFSNHNSFGDNIVSVPEAPISEHCSPSSGEKTLNGLDKLAVPSPTTRAVTPMVSNGQPTVVDGTVLNADIHKWSTFCINALKEIDHEVPSLLDMGPASSVIALLTMWNILPGRQLIQSSEWIRALDLCVKSLSGQKWMAKWVAMYAVECELPELNFSDPDVLEVLVQQVTYSVLNPQNSTGSG